VPEIIPKIDFVGSAHTVTLAMDGPVRQSGSPSLLDCRRVRELRSL
jgi:hypothetical protein